MNAVIVDIRKKQAAALDETGRVVRIPNTNYEIGQTIELHEVKPVRTPTMLKRLSTGVAAAVLVAMIGTGTAYAMPYGTVTLDGDASLEYTINCFDYVLDVKGTNEEGEALLAEIDTRHLRHHRIDSAVAATMERMEYPASANLPEAGPRIVADTGNDHHTERLQQELEPLIEREPPAVPTDDHVPQPAAPGNEEPLPVPGQESPYASAANGEQNAEGPEQPNEGPLQESESFGEGFARLEEFPERHDEHDPSETFDHTDPEPSMDAPSEQMDRQMPPTIAG